MSAEKLKELCSQLSAEELFDHLNTILPVVNEKMRENKKTQSQTKSSSSKSHQISNKFDKADTGKIVILLVNGLYSEAEAKQFDSADSSFLNDTSVEAELMSKSDTHLILKVLGVNGIEIKFTPLQYFFKTQANVNKSNHLNKSALEFISTSPRQVDKTEFAQLRRLLRGSKLCSNSVGSSSSNDTMTEAFYAPWKKKKTSSESKAVSVLSLDSDSGNDSGSDGSDEDASSEDAAASDRSAAIGHRRRMPFMPVREDCRKHQKFLKAKLNDEVTISLRNLYQKLVAVDEMAINKQQVLFATCLSGVIVEKDDFFVTVDIICGTLQLKVTPNQFHLSCLTLQRHIEKYSVLSGADLEKLRVSNSEKYNIIMILCKESSCFVKQGSHSLDSCAAPRTAHQVKSQPVSNNSCRVKALESESESMESTEDTRLALNYNKYFNAEVGDNVIFRIKNLYTVQQTEKLLKKDRELLRATSVSGTIASKTPQFVVIDINRLDTSIRLTPPRFQQGIDNNNNSKSYYFSANRLTTLKSSDNTGDRAVYKQLRRLFENSVWSTLTPVEQMFSRNKLTGKAQHAAYRAGLERGFRAGARSSRCDDIGDDNHSSNGSSSDDGFIDYNDDSDDGDSSSDVSGGVGGGTAESHRCKSDRSYSNGNSSDNGDDNENMKNSSGSSAVSSEVRIVPRQVNACYRRRFVVTEVHSEVDGSSSGGESVVMGQVSKRARIV